MIQSITTNIIHNQNLIYIIEDYFVQEEKWLVDALPIMEWYLLEGIQMIIKDGHLLDWKIGLIKKFFPILKKLKHGLKEKMNTGVAVEYYQ